MGATNFWILHGPGWSLPIRAFTDSGFARVEPAGTLTRAMRAAVQARIEALGTTNGEHWFIMRDTLNHFADKIEGDPDDAISWTTYPGRVALTKQPEGMEGFFEEFVRCGYASSVGEAQVRYGQLCDRLFNRLAAERKPVDLGFVTMHPLPVRGDWMEFIRQMIRIGIWQRYGSKTIPEGFRIFKRQLANPRMFMYDKYNDVLLWTITLKHKAVWWKAIIKTEKERRTAGIGYRYFTEVRKFLKSRCKEMNECFREFVSQTRRPFVVFNWGVVGKSYNGPRLGNHKKTVAVFRGRSACGALDLRTGKESKPKWVGRPHKVLPKVPDLQPAPADVRDGGPTVAQPTDGANGAGGVHLLDSSESLPPGL